MEISSLIDKHRAWEMLNEAGLGSMKLATERYRQLAVSKYAELGKETSRICALLDISSQSALITSVEEALLRAESLSAEMTISRASDEDIAEGNRTPLYIDPRDFRLIGNNKVFIFRLIGENQIFGFRLIGKNKIFELRLMRLFRRQENFLFPSNRNQGKNMVSY